jgi:hypothetical protein
MGKSSRSYKHKGGLIRRPLHAACVCGLLGGVLGLVFLRGQGAVLPAIIGAIFAMLGSSWALFESSGGCRGRSFEESTWLRRVLFVLLLGMVGGPIACGVSLLLGGPGAVAFAGTAVSGIALLICGVAGLFLDLTGRIPP